MAKDDPGGNESTRSQVNPTLAAAAPAARPVSNKSALEGLSPLRNIRRSVGPLPRSPIPDKAYVSSRHEHASFAERISAGLRIGLTLFPAVANVQVIDTQESQAAKQGENQSLSQSAALRLVSSQLSGMKQSLAAVIERLRRGGDPQEAAGEIQGTVKRLTELSLEHRRLLEEEQLEKAYDAAWERLNEVLEEKKEDARSLTQGGGGASGREKFESLLELAFALQDAIAEI